ncbi:hypothetical protein PN36_20065 [Candidatus Thiomargarita nelsonii]|uniref:Uncharacterized protein n=1 Tax=Candidatus Thiomargarita nelsonii TaxID=1003181 RepID=A0A4E0RRA1_9GAMM|nr:hypothetical protein PN36_20065 [Candidatus Thiomargarita nelsonii]
MGENFINLYPVSLSQLKAKIGIGEAYISSRKKHISRRANEAYEIIGYYILGKVARQIEQAIKSGNFDQKQQNNKQLIERLKRNRTYLSIEQSTSEKLIENLKKGNFEYILDRVQKKITEIFSTVGWVERKRNPPISLNMVGCAIALPTRHDYFKSASSASSVIQWFFFSYEIF